MIETAPAFADLLARIDARLAAPGPLPAALADAQLAEGEAVLEAWLHAKGTEPGHDRVEGFRLLALHRQGARLDASFNACRETCREIVYLRNLILGYADDTAQIHHHLRLQAMVLRHLALFLGGKLVEAGLGDFCCAARPIRATDRPDTPNAARPRRAS